MSDAALTRCAAASCSEFAARISIKNNSAEMYCLPGEYYGDDVAESVELYDKKLKDWQGQETPYRHEAYIMPSDAVKRLDYVRSKPNIIVQPGEEKAWDALTGPKFSTPKSSVRFRISLLAYPCSGKGPATTLMVEGRAQPSAY